MPRGGSRERSRAVIRLRHIGACFVPSIPSLRLATVVPRTQPLHPTDGRFGRETLDLGRSALLAPILHGHRPLLVIAPPTPDLQVAQREPFPTEAGSTDQRDGPLVAGLDARLHAMEPQVSEGVLEDELEALRACTPARRRARARSSRGRRCGTPRGRSGRGRNSRRSHRRRCGRPPGARRSRGRRPTSSWYARASTEDRTRDDEGHAIRAPVAGTPPRPPRGSGGCAPGGRA